VERLRVSYPALTAAKVDPGLKRLFLAELITQHHNEGMEVVLPEGTATRVVSRDTFNQYRDTLSGLDVGGRRREVEDELMRIGLSGGGRPQGPPSYGGGGYSQSTWSPGS